ncbi:hypothetical protein [Acuticoccus sp. I52.16.1]|uniref:hypothetical protein n=1 Tax=Acuticoccus sp. I52.16.1 TaxID=2928472 RepID=UPI001FD08F21|nr:hypothetical protein [Acuticoccus sp. I52.16.1]UOM37044.1 hypothetical protein MRB58_23440 [Acuticoccus sp. I52.16.1]
MSTRRSSSSPPLSEEIAARIKALWAHTELTQAEIAARLGGINQGRVSEVIRGLRYRNVPPAELGGF